MRNSILSHTGIFNLSSIDTLLSRFKVVSQEIDLKFSVYKKIITVMIESLENVCKYTDTYIDFVTDHNEFLPTFSIIENQTSIQLKTTNPVRNEDVASLQERIEQVNEKDRSGLKELYLETIADGKFSPKGGAGLGFIEMAKISGNELECSFDPITKEYSLFTFIVTFAL